MNPNTLSYRRCLLIGLFMGFLSTPLLAQSNAYKQVHAGNKQYRKQDFASARTNYFDASKSGEHNGHINYNIACASVKQNPLMADSLFRTVGQSTQTAKPLRAKAWHNLGVMKQSKALQDATHKQQLLQEAIDNYKEALKLNPQDKDTRYNLALCQSQLLKQPNPKQQNKQQKQQQQQQNKQQNNQQQQNKQPDASNGPKGRNQQYLNLSNQAEQRTLKKIKGARGKASSLEKNW